MATDRLSVGDRYAELVMAAKPASYWRFTRTPSGVLENEVAGGVNLMMGGEVSTVSYGTNSVLEFGMTRHAGYLYSEALWPATPLSEFSAEVWVKPSHFHNGSILALTTERDARGKYPNHAMLLELGGAQSHWRSLTPLNSLRYLLRSPPSGDQEGEFGSSVPNGYEVRRWQHLVYVKRDDRLELFRNGARVAVDDGGDSRVIASELQIVCGRLYPHGSERLFVGQMDELAIYEHALTESEVRTHFVAGASNAATPDAI
ncbi:hypothetical protein Pla123a_41330 [Posidoniimonas polymericola]|uniref:LamG-like jellyroll fold domain-containing protein n=2 Tax=Posidoniimonas polymericola TaxID=2528002 RepID=A0A5C5YHG0_9BACT|nr:hypothetical protein Pla123a_41330 [Posidoniimonas polymericola]